MADFIPSNDDAFDHFFATLQVYVSANFAALGVSAGLNTALGDAYTNWTEAWGHWQDEQPTYNSLLAAKNAARRAAEPAIRQVNAVVQANPAVTAAQKEAAELPVHKTTRTPVAPIETHPVLYRVDNEHLLQRLWFSDQATPGSKAKPKGATLCEIRQSVVAPGGTAPVNPDAMPLLALDTKSPHRTDFDAADPGKTAYYAQRWVNTRGEPGPWSVITSYLVT